MLTFGEEYDALLPRRLFPPTYNLEDNDEPRRVTKRSTQPFLQRATRGLGNQEMTLVEEDGDEYFNCSACGQFGLIVDDSSHYVAYDVCNVWQHSECHSLSPEQAEQDGFFFLCTACNRQAEGGTEQSTHSLAQQAVRGLEDFKTGPITEVSDLDFPLQAVGSLEDYEIRSMFDSSADSFSVPLPGLDSTSVESMFPNPGPSLFQTAT